MHMHMQAAGLYHLEDTGAACGSHPIYSFATGGLTNRWIYSHQPAIWRRDALLNATPPSPTTPTTAPTTPPTPPHAGGAAGEPRARLEEGRQVSLGPGSRRLVSEEGAVVSSGGVLEPA